MFSVEDILKMAILHQQINTQPQHLEEFWRNYQGIDPEHPVFEVHAGRLMHCLPMVLHGDEGRGKKKLPLGAISIQCMLGHGSSVNAKGNTMTSRFLIALLPHRTQKQQRDLFLKLLLQRISFSLKSLFSEGVSVPPRGHFYIIPFGTKGDWPWLSKTGNLNRTFAHVPNPICHFCLAGPIYPWEDFSNQPRWRTTCFTTRPWTVPSPLTQVPHGGFPEELFHPDMFHTLKLGFLQYLAASAIVCLTEAGLLCPTTVSFEVRLQFAFEDFLSFCNSIKKRPYMTCFSKNNLGFPNDTTYPDGNWGKGSDSRLLVLWLEAVAQRCFFAEHWVKLLYVTCQSFNGFYRLLHSCSKSSVWLTRAEAHTAAQNGLRSLRGYAALAKLFFSKGSCRFPLKPKLHSFHHMLLDLHYTESIALNPLVWNCEADEDFIGHICRLARKSHIRSLQTRTLERYLINIRATWARKK
jgi:hypothetical protein